MLPEQVWDAAEIPARELYPGRPSGSAMPLAWAHAEYVKLRRSLREGRVFDLPPEAAQRYLAPRGDADGGARRSVWRFGDRIATMDRGSTLRIEVFDAAVVHWSADGWRTLHDTATRDTGLGVHVADLPAMASRDGYIGIKDFPGDVVKAYEENGWVFYGRAIVAKNPQAQAIRTKAKALLFVQLRKDSSDSRPAILDHILIFKKPGENAVPIRPVDSGEMDNETWIDWAGGIWTGINESDTLQYQSGRDADDEKHICPLQLGTIERCIKLYSNPGETVLTPFMGIGSEAYQAVKFGRRAIGIELKDSYFAMAVRNLRTIEAEKHVPTLFDLVTQDSIA